MSASSSEASNLCLFASMPEANRARRGVVIIGAGQAAAQAIASLRQEGYTGSIVMVGEEKFLPYQRPPLSKGFLSGDLPVERLMLRPSEFYERANVDCLLGVPASNVDPDARIVTLQTGRQIPYDSLIFATGGRPRRLDCPGSDNPNIYYLRNIRDAEALRARFQPGARLTIVGGGYVGLEVASIAIKRGLSVTLLEFAPRVLSRVACSELASFYEQVHREAGVEIITGTAIGSVESGEAGLRVTTTDGISLDTDFILAGIGQLPNVELAQAAGVACDNGIIVDEDGRTSVDGIYAAGDCASHPSAIYQCNLRLESVPNAIEQARTVAATICGQSRPYRQLPWFWSDQFDLKLQIAGISRGYDQVVLRGDPSARSFAVFYLKERRLIAVDAVNKTLEFVAAKPLIEAKTLIETVLLQDESIPLASVVLTPV